jgi:hypothetical protein
MGKVVVYAPAERAGTLPLFLLYPYIPVCTVLCGFHLARKTVFWIREILAPIRIRIQLRLFLVSDLQDANTK